MKRLLIGGLTTLAIGVGVSPVAGATDIICRTDRMSGSSYEYCHWIDSDGIRHGIVTTCYANSNHCTTREEH